MRENSDTEPVTELRGGGTSRLDGGHEVKKASNLKILGYYGTRTVISIFRILGNFIVSDGTATFPLAHRRGATCHCEEGVCPTSQSHNSCNMNEITTSNASHSPRNDIKLTYRPNVLSSYRLKNKFSSRFTLHSSLNKRAAFTLAEVLITLGIIGVVAAITMPALMANYQKMVLRQQFKKAYNTVLNGYRLAEVNLGFHPMCYYGDDWIGAPCIEYDDKGECVKYGEAVNPTNQLSDCTVLRNELQKTLKVIKICKGNGVADGCIPEYNGMDSIVADNNPDLTEEEITTATTGASGWRTSNIHNKSHIWVLADGIIIIWYGSSTTLFAVDINGMKGPNKWGHDFFPFILKSNLNKAIWLEGYGTRVEKGGVSTSQMLKDMGK